MRNNLLLQVLLWISPVSVLALEKGVLIDDSSLSSGITIDELVSTEILPDSLSSSPQDEGFSLVLQREVDGQLQPLAGLDFEVEGVPGIRRSDASGGVRLDECPSQKIELRSDLRSDRFTVQQSYRSQYSLQLVLDCPARHVAMFEKESHGGQAMAIFQVAYKIQEGLRDSVGLGFWQDNLAINWPARGDYYTHSVYLSLGHQWDVVGHEIGHAIYDRANIGVFAGGQHYIDRCYNSALAFSEGWASYLSAWASLDRNDPDARFEYLVPRRAPVQIENVPDDVCWGTTNEWRVSSFFWDLYDLNEDRESAEESFAGIWRLMLDKRARSVEEVRDNLIEGGMDEVLVHAAWILNFGTDVKLY